MIFDDLGMRLGPVMNFQLVHGWHHHSPGVRWKPVPASHYIAMVIGHRWWIWWLGWMDGMRLNNQLSRSRELHSVFTFTSKHLNTFTTTQFKTQWCASFTLQHIFRKYRISEISTLMLIWTNSPSFERNVTGSREVYKHVHGCLNGQLCSCPH